MSYLDGGNMAHDTMMPRASSCDIQVDASSMVPASSSIMSVSSLTSSHIALSVMMPNALNNTPNGTVLRMRGNCTWIVFIPDAAGFII